jgi:hypothetical protein
MGDRANVLVKDGDSRVYLYTHWNGWFLPDTLQAALRRGRDRWIDGQYLARIIFCEMVKETEMETTGYGIFSDIRDNGHDILSVDSATGTVTLESEDGEPQHSPWTFEEFCSLPISEHEDSWEFLANS